MSTPEGSCSEKFKCSFMQRPEIFCENSSFHTCQSFPTPVSTGLPPGREESPQFSHMILIGDDLLAHRHPSSLDGLNQFVNVLLEAQMQLVGGMCQVHGRVRIFLSPSLALFLIRLASLTLAFLSSLTLCCLILSLQPNKTYILLTKAGIDLYITHLY